jgi:hypothetical protein
MHFNGFGLRAPIFVFPSSGCHSNVGSDLEANQMTRDKKSLIDQSPLLKSVWRLATKNIQFHSQVSFDPYMLQLYGTAQ